MKTNFVFYFAIVAFFALFFACKSNKSDTNSTFDATEETASEKTTKGKYAMKSGIVVYNTQMMGMDVKQIMYFDDYGSKTAQEVMMEMMDVKVHSLTIIKDNFVYTIDMVKKTGTKTPVMGGKVQDIDFQNISEELAADMELKKLGTEEFLGKTCEKMSIDYKKMGMKGTFLLYKGVALQSKTDLGGMKVTLVAEKFEENPTIPAEKFEIPADIMITETK